MSKQPIRKPELSLDVTTPEAVLTVLHAASHEYTEAAEEIANNPHDPRPYSHWLEIAKALESCADEISHLLSVR